MPAGRSPIRAIVADFDGTIVDRDVSEAILDAFAGPQWSEIDLEFQRGEIGSRECLVRQAALLEGRQDEMLEFAISRYRLDSTFGPFVRWARGEGLEIAVASDGLGFHVEPMLRAAGIEGVTVFTNDVRIAEGRAPVLGFPHRHSMCVGCGTCKMSIVLRYRDRFGPVAFIGEGHTDRYGALYSDLVFAKKHLPQICRADGVPFLLWESFDDVRRSLESNQSVPGPVAPDRCPGWSVR